ncbi:MAG: VOC family protein [Myxococcales bacterium]|nr:VOC family protein [Myxococcales bacterium]
MIKRIKFVGLTVKDFDRALDFYVKKLGFKVFTDQPAGHSFVRRGCATYHCGPCSLSAQALDRLLGYAWPGNVRELEHAMERAVVLAEGKPKIEKGDLPPEFLGRARPSSSDDGELLSLAVVERRHVLHVLERCGGNRKETAKVLGIATNTLWRKLREYGVIEDRDD